MVFETSRLFSHSQFEIKDLGTLSYILGLEVNSGSIGAHLSQTKYASYLIAKT